jgi:hypothetical protein
LEWKYLHRQRKRESEREREKSNSGAEDLYLEGRTERREKQYKRKEGKEKASICSLILQVKLFLEIISLCSE